MPKTLTRLIVLLLVPALIADPTTATVLTNSLAPGGRGRSPLASGVRGDVCLYTRQVVPAPLEWMPRFAGSIGRAMRRLADTLRRAPSEPNAAAPEDAGPSNERNALREEVDAKLTKTKALLSELQRQFSNGNLRWYAQIPSDLHKVLEGYRNDIELMLQICSTRLQRIELALAVSEMAPERDYSGILSKIPAQLDRIYEILMLTSSGLHRLTEALEQSVPTGTDEAAHQRFKIMEAIGYLDRQMSQDDTPPAEAAAAPPENASALLHRIGSLALRQGPGIHEAELYKLIAQYLQIKRGPVLDIAWGGNPGPAQGFSEAGVLPIFGIQDSLTRYDARWDRFLTPIVGNALTLPIRNDYASTIIFNEALDWIRIYSTTNKLWGSRIAGLDVQEQRHRIYSRAFSEALRVLQLGGRIIIKFGVNDEDIRSVEAPLCQQLLRDMGFEDVRLISVDEIPVLIWATKPPPSRAAAAPKEVLAKASDPNDKLLKKLSQLWKIVHFGETAYQWDETIAKDSWPNDSNIVRLVDQKGKVIVWLDYTFDQAAGAIRLLGLSSEITPRHLAGIGSALIVEILYRHPRATQIMAGAFSKSGRRLFNHLQPLGLWTNVHEIIEIVNGRKNSWQVASVNRNLIYQLISAAVPVTRMTKDKPSFIFLDSDNFVTRGTFDLVKNIYGEIYWRAKNRMGLGPTDIEPTAEDLRPGIDFFYRYTNIPDADHFIPLLEEVGLKGEDPAPYIEFFKRRLDAQYKNYARLMPGAREFLEALHQKRAEGYDIHVFLLSSSSDFALTRIVDHLGIRSYFDKVIAPPLEIGQQFKKSRYIIAIAGQVSPRFVAMGGDSPKDILAGKEATEAGIETFTFATPTGMDSKDALEKSGADLVVPSLTERDTILKGFIESPSAGRPSAPESPALHLEETGGRAAAPPDEPSITRSAETGTQRALDGAS
jgi:phosphoglycolate phosphatase-like HAD superfamily hydrolase